MNPIDRMANGYVVQYRPKYPRSPRGAAQNKFSDYTLIQSASDTFGRPHDAPEGAFEAMIQVFGHQADDQAGGDVVKDMWSFWCRNRDVRQGDLFTLKMNPGEVPEVAPDSPNQTSEPSSYNFELPFFVRAEDYTTYPNTGNIVTFMRVFCVGVAPPEGYSI